MHLPGFSSTVLWALLASADDSGVREPNVRTLLLADPSRGQVPTLYVGERLTTVLRLDQACVPARTTLLGWEGRFEPVLCHGRAVYLHPVRELAPEDRFLLRVTLADGTEWPFTVAAREQGSHRHPVDQQVDVFTQPEGVERLRAALSLALRYQAELGEQVARYQREETSVDHAWATLLADGRVKETPFERLRLETLEEGGVKMTVLYFVAMERTKVAVVIDLENIHGTAPWRLGETRLSALKNPLVTKPFALRMNRPEIDPGASGRIVVVVDRREFTTDAGLVDLNLDMAQWEGTLRVSIMLDRRLLKEKK
ncbi:hypothetical protein D187_005177 [Cystobacter fuscus DSM 2262]|uniref:DUF2381 family protein n=1 Tax=Cystobacter fuscus (strain ATCC 25194 / DSM 2262 / NBRC 100088 / M29) TaxID=1242864 RepID=S9QRZ9_CYSF2|nr:DUF2381 family protein [Cystobacter fuscus]EPX64044.1 hypothetical protein D187_005177 [Cystobacter fuscus DSM 2262]